MVHPATRVELLEFQTPPPGSEVIRYSYWSRKLLPAAALAASYQFFSDQVGVGTVTGRDTNMTKPSAIGNPRRFLAQFINCHVYAGGSTSCTLVNVGIDTCQVINTSNIRIDLLDKEYLTLPTWMVPCGGGPVIQGSTGTAAGPVVGALTVLNGVPDKRNAYPIELPLEREASFSVALQFPGTPPTLSVVGGIYVDIVLTGLLIRPRQ